ncbi:MAG: PD40 domain-containing protein, partial [Armatimonadetes bacterium]|nr:PD40 domain-containing protein [Armatimonadota bacterium]
IMRSDGSNEVQLTSNTADDVQPCWSPDAGWIAFASLRDGNYEIYKMQPDGSNPTRLTNNAAMDLSPVWSPDGSRIMWLREGDLWEMNADGSNQHLVKADLADWSVSLDWWGPTSDRYRVFIGPSGSDFGGANPPFGTSRNSAIVTFGTSGLGGCVTVGSDAGMPTITYIGNAGGPMVVEVRAQAGRPGVNRVLEDRGPGVPIGLYDMPDDDPGSGKAYPQAVLLAFAAETGRLMAVMGVRVTAAGTARAAGGTPLLEQRGGQLVVRAPICAVFTPDNPSRNLAPSGASAVVLCSRTGRVLEIK